MNLFYRVIPFLKKEKVFGIGLSKTGTTSLCAALNLLGIRSIHFPRTRYLREKARGLSPFSTLKEYTGFADFPCWAIYRELDRLYPGSKFILTVRDAEKWFESRKKHYKRRLDQGITMNWDMSEDSVRKMTQHNEQVMEYFKGRPGDLLLMNIIEGDGWEKLCPFLGKKIPKAPFPKKNTADRLE